MRATADSCESSLGITNILLLQLYWQGGPYEPTKTPKTSSLVRPVVTSTCRGAVLRASTPFQSQSRGFGAMRFRPTQKTAISRSCQSEAFRKNK